VANLNWTGVPTTTTTSSASATYEEPIYDVHEMNGLIPADPRKPFDVKKVISRIVDGSRFHEFKAEYGNTIVTGFAELYGAPVGMFECWNVE
jgi:3-methylcrotonyl-CoA carboxylase beta subunit